MKRRHRIEKALHLIGAVLLFVAVLEVCARIDDGLKWHASFFGTYSVDRLFGYDEEGIPINVAGAHYEKWAHNNMGFRGAEIWRIKPSGQVRIICLGSSETYGTCESRGQEWPAQLERMLRGKGHFKVINAAGPGFSLRDYHRYFEKYCLPLNPDVVLILVNPFFQVAQCIKPPARQQSRRTPPIPWLSRLRILAKAKQALRQIVPEGLLRLYHVNKFKRKIAEEESRRPAISTKIDMVPSSCLAAYQKELAKFIKDLKGKGIEPILGSYPSLLNRENINRYPELFLEHRLWSMGLYFTSIVDVADPYNKATQSLARQMDLAFVDLAEVVPKDRVHFCEVIHYTDQGARLVARSFAQAVMKNCIQP